MSSKDKELSKSKFKSFLKNTKNPAGTSVERSLRPETEYELRPEQPVAQRCKILKDLSDIHLQSLNLEETAIVKLWDTTKDLLVPTKSPECRQTALTFYKRLIYTQYKNLTYMREQFFLVIQNHEVDEDLRHRLELLDTLTENGKDIKNLEEKIGRFMLLWLPAIHQANFNLLRPYLEMLGNLIKFNAAHLDNDIIIGIVQNACNLSCTVSDEDIGLQCLTILEMVMGYTIFPSDPLPQFVFTLCRTVNVAPYCRASWKIMKNLLGTELGYHSMKMMCNILNDRSLYEDEYLLRGAVFHLTMNIFGVRMVFQVSPLFYASMVLNSFLRALDSRHVCVTYEVIVGIHILITKYKSELPEIIWDRICDIMSAIVSNMECYEKVSADTEGLKHLNNHFHENINCIEKLLQDEKTKILANYDRIYDLIERVAESRPESSVLMLIDYRSSKITATRPEWLQLLNSFVQRFYRMPSTPIRIKVIQSLVNIMDLNRSCYEEEILERVVVPLFAQVCNETDVQLRCTVANALIDFARHCDTKRCGELLDLLEKIINRPYEQYKLNGEEIKSEQDIQDVVVAVDGLIEVFLVKLYRLPSCHAIKIFNILVAHLEQNYNTPKVFEQANIVRYKIFSWMLKARANALYHIGYPDPSNNDCIKYSYYLGIDSSLPAVHETSTQHHHQRHQLMTQLSAHDASVPNPHFTTISIKKACEMIVKCLEKDRDFQIFQLVIKELPKIMQNKALIQGNDIESLAAALFKIIFESNKTLHVTYKSSIDELNSLVLPAIASLVIYHKFIQPSNQYKIIDVLKMGILSGIANICINTMTTIILEMPEALMRKLPDILLQMSKMSDTPTVAISVLEFLSILSRLPNDLFTNFTPRQYMYVFAISLAYTKPHRYDHYTVSLAHHVIAGWFLKCKLELRKNCVTYIISSIQSNASMLYEDINKLSRNIQRQDLNSLNEDSSNRKRSTSLTERGSRNTSAVGRNDSEMRPLMNASLKSFHAELAETCIDFLARHTFSPCSALPKRLPAVEYLLKDGHSQTWLVGHNLVTITTSGCPSGPTRSGLCDRCSQLGKAYTLSPKASTDTNPGTSPISPEISQQSQTAAPTYEHRYTKVSLQHSSGNESAGSTDLTSSSSSTSHTTQRQTSNSSTASLEALSRRGSNPEAGSTDLGVGGSCASLLGNSLSSSSVCAAPVCVRSCTAWAEIFIRRPTGNISWITRIQNPISNECFGYDVPFSSMVSLFLPTAQGGVFGPDFFQTENVIDLNISTEIKETPSPMSIEISKQEVMDTKPIEEQRVRSTSKTRPLQRQEEISSSAVTVAAAAGTAAIDIPKKTSGSRGKDDPCRIVSDGEADEDYIDIEGEQMRPRKPVRRVNSSPEMSSSWRNTLMENKPAPLSQECPMPVEQASDSNAPQQQQIQQKKKTVQYSKVSCEAIPEEIAGSTPPQNLGSSASTLKAPESGTLPPKQLSADDVSQKSSSVQIPVQQSASSTSLRSTGAGGQDDKLVNKPPLSPAPQHSPRMEKSHAPAVKSTSFGSHQGLAKSSSGGNSVNMTSLTSGGGNSNNDYNNGEMRGRSKTISVVREVNNGKSRPTTNTFSRFGNNKPQLNTKLCMHPSFVFMQLYHTGQIQVTDAPIKVPPEQMSAVSLLDLAPPFETHKIGVLYVGQGQCNNVVEILRNSHGSTRYVEFLRGIGTLVSLKEAAQNNLFITLDTCGADGKFTYVWKDDIVQVTFHVATLMPTKLTSDPNCNEKKKHIGNDYVNIIYNESGEEYNLNTISGQFNYACVIVEPLELNTNRIYVKVRPEIATFVYHPGPKIVSDKSAPLLARQLALHANLASNVYQSLQKKNPYASNWLERLRSIKRLRTKLIENQTQGGATAAHADIDDRSAEALNKQNTNRDFTKYT
ncbi:TSC complex subunit tuberin isoform X2 [Haematobia irritans]|uniref:TSC complex subunit tuberin isoform X2 n=1 Tax=Haematobia irritans TaxID=7368 RepID=UPI003F50BE59